MPKQTKAGTMIHRSAGDGPATTALDLERLRATMRRAVRTDDIPELKGTEARVCRDASGKLSRRRQGPVRRAVLESLDDHKMTRYELWTQYEPLPITRSSGEAYEEPWFTRPGVAEKTSRSRSGLAAKRRSLLVLITENRLDHLDILEQGEVLKCRRELPVRNVGRGQTDFQLFWQVEVEVLELEKRCPAIEAEHASHAGVLTDKREQNVAVSNVQGYGGHCAHTFPYDVELDPVNRREFIDLDSADALELNEIVSVLVKEQAGVLQRVRELIVFEVVW
jgi:hypothetical protein